jgi:cobalt-zinc-cadmium efflux system membrane fusion protein
LAAQPGTSARRIASPGTVIPHADHIAHVSVKVSGTLAELRKKVGDTVEANDALAILESRDFAEAKSEYLAARLANDLQQDLFEREKALWEKKIAPEQDYLRSRNQAATAKMRNDITREKLFALGLTQQDIADFAERTRNQPASPACSLADRGTHRRAQGRARHVRWPRRPCDRDLRRRRSRSGLGRSDDQPCRSAAGQRGPGGIDHGARNGPAGPGQDHLHRADHRQGQPRRACGGGNPNGGGIWRFGSFVTAAIAIGERQAAVIVPSTAIQTMGTASVVFVRTAEGFQKRRVGLGEGDEQVTEVVFGLRPGEMIATSNTFVLKAELLQVLAED